jgi:hypothetical protein
MLASSFQLDFFVIKLGRSGIRIQRLCFGIRKNTKIRTPLSYSDIYNNKSNTDEYVGQLYVVEVANKTEIVDVFF